MFAALLGPLTAAALVAASAVTPESHVASVEVLLKDLRARKSTTRVAAVAALADIRPVRREVLEALVDKLSDKDGNVRTATRQTLEQLSSADGFSELAAGLTRPPRPIEMTKPVYPHDAFIKKIEGSVLLEILIDSQGRVVRARVIQSVPLLDAAALQCIYQWVFQPAVKDGRLVPTIAHAPLNFRIY
jgi:TonB family protein